MSIHRLAALAVLLALVAPLSLADEEADDHKLVVQLIDVSALTTGHVDYIPPMMGTTAPDMFSDEDNPLFGSEGEEPILALGTIDELIEIVKFNVDPVSWQITEGADMRSMGERTLIVRATRTVLRKVARYLADLETDVLTTVTLEVRAVAVPDGGTTATLDQLLAVDGPSVTVSGFAGQRVEGLASTQFSYVQDYDVEVAQDSRISDPIVGVANWGFSVSARTVAARGADKLRTMLRATLAIPKGMRDHDTESDRIIELPEYDEVTVLTDLLLTPGAWQVTQGNARGSNAGRWVFLVRGSAARVPVRSPGEGTLLDPSIAADAGPLVSRSFDISDLEQVLPNRQGEALYLVPSNFTPPAPPELAEPAPILAGEAIPDLIRESVVPGSWNRDGTNIDVRYGLLFVTNTERVMGRITALLAFLRKQFMWTVVLDTRIVDVPTSLGRQLVAPTGGAAHMLDDAKRAALAQGVADGQARIVDKVKVTSLSGARNSLLSGTRFTYVQDFEVELAEKSSISNPVVQLGTEGVVVDLLPTPTSTGDAVNLGLSVARTRLAGKIRQVATPHGPLDAPALRLFRLRGNLRVPFGQTAVVGAGGEAGRMLVLLVRPVLKPYGS